MVIPLLDWSVIIGFLVATLAIGLRAGRGVRDIKDYATGNCVFGTGALALTLLATKLSGIEVIDDTGKVFATGALATLVAIVGKSLRYLFAGLFVVPHAVYFKECMTLGDLMYRFYGWGSSWISGVLNLLRSCMFCALNLMLIGSISKALLGINPVAAIVASGVLLSLYMARGGLKSVVATDIFHFCFMSLCVPLISYFMLTQAGGLKQVVTHAPAAKLAIWSHPRFWHYLCSLFVLAIPANMIDTPSIQRLLLGNSPSQLRNQYFVVGAYNAAFNSALLFMGISGLILYPQIASDRLVLHAIQDLIPAGLQGLMAAALLSACISSIDSYLHAASLTLAHDLVVPFVKKRGWVVDELLWARAATLLLSAGATLLALHIHMNGSGVFDTVLMATNLASPVLMFPLFAAMMGLKPHKRSFYVAAVATLIAFVSCKLMVPKHLGYMSVLTCIAVNGLAFFGSHYWHYSGFVIEKRGNGSLPSSHLWRPSSRGLGRWLLSLIPTPSRLLAYTQKRAREHEVHYVLFGIFFLVNYMFPLFMWPAQSDMLRRDFMLWLRFFGGLWCVLLITREKWWDSLVPYLPLFWHFTLLYCLPFTSTVMFLLTDGSLEWLIHIATTILFLLLLVEWKAFLVMVPLGVAAGLGVHHYFLGHPCILFDFDTSYAVVYQVVFGTLIGLLFARKKQLGLESLRSSHARVSEEKQQHSEKLVELLSYQQRLARGLGREGRDVLREASVLEAQLTKAIAAKDYKALAALEAKFHHLSSYLEQVAHTSTSHLSLEVSEFLLDSLLEGLQQAIAYLSPQPAFFNHSRATVLQGDKARLQKMLTASLEHLQTHAQGRAQVQLHIQDTQLAYPINAPEGRTKHIAALRLLITTEGMQLPALQPFYTADLSAALSVPPEKAEALPLVTALHIATAHYGLATPKEEYKNLWHSYIIPVQVRQVRSKLMDSGIDRSQLSAMPTDYKGAAEKELGLLNAIKEQAPKVNLDKVHKALYLIRKYHAPQTRKSGEPFYLHPMAVCQLLLQRTQDEQMLLAALLHDIVEDTPLTLDELGVLFNPTVAKLVDGVTKLDRHHRKVALSKAETLDKLATQSDERALAIKVADRWHNMLTLHGHKPAKRVLVAQETCTFFVPMARRIGWDEAARAMEGLVGQALQA